MEKSLQAKFIAKRVAGELKFGDFVNLGVGLPTAISDYVDADRGILFHGENGVIGLGKATFDVIDSFKAKSDSLPVEEALVINAGASKTSINPGASFFDSGTSFGYYLCESSTFSFNPLIVRLIDSGVFSCNKPHSFTFISDSTSFFVIL